MTPLPTSSPPVNPTSCELVKTLTATTTATTATRSSQDDASIASAQSTGRPSMSSSIHCRLESNPSS
eukprot:CAMPEP_0113857738 /NCGR_PEP_ID=MMETSP0372-20130328/10533_1 /TAXON_ID=340204 /ORGANISM="Lankesteria abbotti" /LENGTH=66 /DNA_ID=CAMNT_0000834033 /DNA_START=24 /DNA_END=220 /DNA_ORIENTATION=+ /assembly_acc=CAM_ASM_000359